MNSEEALAVVEAILKENRLSKLQRIIFCHVWEDQSYLEIARRSGYELGYVKQAGSQLWQLLSQALNEKVTKHTVQHIVQRKLLSAKENLNNGQRESLEPESTQTIAALQAGKPARFIAHAACPRCDWGDAVDVSAFYGRTIELTTLEQWVVQDGCRLVGVFGMGGIGKTSLAVRLAKQIQGRFDYVIWRSLRNAPPIQDLLADLIQLLSNQQEINVPDSASGGISTLLRYLRQSRCLIILDNGETVMMQGNHHGGYLPGYEDYDQLWQAIGESCHQSTLILTSREKPKGMAAKEGKALPVRSLRLAGLPAAIGQEIFNIKGDFAGSDEAWQMLIDHYAGNPLALKMVAPVIQDLFDGHITDFLECLQEGTLIFSDIQDLLAQQINRLSALEQHVLYWLAVARKPLTLSQLRANFTSTIALNQLLEALTSLERRCLIDKATASLPEKPQARFTLQPVVMEYLTDRLIERVCAEIWEMGADGEREEWTGAGSGGHLSTIQALSLFQSHALIQAQAKDYIRETQTRLILQPIADRLLNVAPDTLEAHFQRILGYLRQRSPQTGYAAGNVINLLCQLGVDLTGWDFSGLPIWSTYLRGVQLHHVNFTGADLARSVFTETFSQILAVAFSPDGKLLATGDVNHEIHIWQVADGKQLLNCKVDAGWVWSVAFSPNGRFLASSANRTVNLWDVQTGACLQTFEGYSDRVFSVAFSPDGWLLATGSEDHLIRIWDLRTGHLLHTLDGHTDEVRSVAFSPVELRSPFVDADMRSLPHESTPALPPSPESRPAKASHWLLASGSFDGTVRLWDASTGKALHLLAGHTGWVWSVAFSPDGQRLASSGSDRTLKLWEVHTGHCLQSLIGHTQQIRTVAFSLDGRTLASGSDDRTVRIWDYRTGEGLRVLSGHSSWIASIAFSPDNHLLASGSEDQSVRLWDSRSLCLKTLQGYSNGVWSVAFDVGGEILASGSQDRVIRMWQQSSGKLLGTLRGHTSWVWSVAFSPVHPLLASGSEDRTIKFWDTQTHTLLHTLEGHQDAVLAVLFHSDGQTLFSASLDGTIKRWTVQTGVCDRTLSEHTGGIWCIALSPNGQLLVSGSQDQTLKLWNVRDGSCFATLSGHQSWIRSVAISPNQTTIASGSADGAIKIWNLAEETCLNTLSAHRGPVLSVVFHPDGQTFASCGTEGEIKIWDASTYQCIQTLQAHDRWVRFLCYSPNGKTLASCSQDETIKLWALVPSLSRMVSPHSRTLRIPRPYEGMAIGQVTGLTPAQKATLKRLGAVDELSRELEVEHRGQPGGMRKLAWETLRKGLEVGV